MKRAILAAVLAVISAVCAAAPVTRWTSAPFEGAGSLHAAGRDTTGLIMLRTGLDPVRSFDGGASWTAFTIAGQRPSGFKGSPTDPRSWYAVVARDVFRTRDGGDTWTPIPATFLAPGSATFLDFSIGADPDLLYTLRQAAYEPGGGYLEPLPPPGFVGLRVSTNGGRTWQDYDFAQRKYDLQIYPSTVDPKVIFRTDDNRLERSDDQGASWVNVTPAAASSFWNSPSVTFDPRDSKVVYFRETVGSSVYVTLDNGATWSQRTVPASFIVVDPLTAGRQFAFGYGGVFESRDGGSTWAMVDPDGAGRLVVAQGRRALVRAGESKIERLDLNDGALALGSDLWWNPAESGAGLTITQHASNRPFVVWYTYDTTGAPVWRVIPGGTWSDRTLSGQMYETTGPVYFGAAFDPDAVSARAVGMATLRFDDENNAVFAHSVNGVVGEKRITRQLFAAPATSPVESYADLWWNAEESGWGMAVNQQHNRIFATWYVYGDDGKPLWVVMPDAVIGQEFVGIVVQPVAAGDIYTARGPAAGAPFHPAQVVPTKIGSAKLHLRGNRIELEYTAFGRTGVRTITRQPF